jgi:hypothetical protein
MDSARMDASARTRHPAPKKRGRGHPTAYKPEYCKSVVEFSSRGYSLTAFAGSIEVCRDTITEWVSVHPEFSLAVKKAKAIAALYWEKRLQVAGSKLGDAAPVIFALKNIAPDDWKSDKQVEVAVHNSITVDTSRPVEEWGAAELETELARRNALPKIPALNGRK